MEAWDSFEDWLPMDGNAVAALKALLQFQLKNSFFEFAGRLFKQLKGLPIGSPIGGPVACLSAMLLEKRHLDKNLPSAVTELAATYIRYLDHFLAVFRADNQQQADEKVATFLTLLNKMHADLQFTTTGAVKSLAFLDIWVEVTDSEIATRKYQKLTDKRVLLNYSSNHPPAVKRAIPHGVALRMRQLCSSDVSLWAALVDEAAVLLAKGFKDQDVVNGFASAMVVNRQDLLKPHVPIDWFDYQQPPKYNKSLINFVVPYANDCHVSQALAKI
jgi:hypothetical protein